MISAKLDSARLVKSEFYTILHGETQDLTQELNSKNLKLISFNAVISEIIAMNLGENFFTQYEYLTGTALAINPNGLVKLLDDPLKFVMQTPNPRTKDGGIIISPGFYDGVNSSEIDGRKIYQGLLNYEQVLGEIDGEEGNPFLAELIKNNQQRKNYLRALNGESPCLVANPDLGESQDVENYLKGDGENYVLRSLGFDCGRHFFMLGDLNMENRWIAVGEDQNP